MYDKIIFVAINAASSDTSLLMALNNKCDCSGVLSI